MLAGLQKLPGNEAIRGISWSQNTILPQHGLIRVLKKCRFLKKGVDKSMRQ